LNKNSADQQEQDTELSPPSPRTSTAIDDITKDTLDINNDTMDAEEEPSGATVSTADEEAHIQIPPPPQPPTVVTPWPLSLEDKRLGDDGHGDDDEEEEDNRMKKKRRRAARNLSILISNNGGPAPCFSTRVKTQHRMDRPEEQVTCIDLCDDD
jgi:hypothetical protein